MRVEYAPMSSQSFSVVDLECRSINNKAVPASGIPSETTFVVTPTLTDSISSTAVTTTVPVTFTISKIGRCVTVTMQGFKTTTPLTNLASWLVTNYTFPVGFRPAVDLTAEEYLAGLDYSYSGATTDHAGQFGINAAGLLQLFGELPAGGFNTVNGTPALSDGNVLLFGASMSYTSDS